MRKTLFHLLLIAITGIIVYSNTLNAPFIWDDNGLILENTRIRDLSNFTNLSGTRYLTYFTFALNYIINGYNVTGYHIFNIAVHLLNAMLVYLLVSVLFRTPNFPPPFNPPLVRGDNKKNNSPLTKGGYRGVALFSGLIFVSHPVYTMAVTNINQRSAPLATLFYLLSLVTYIKFRIQDTRYMMQDTPLNLPLGNSQAGSLTYNNEPSSLKIGQASRLTKRYTLYSISVISAVFAMKCKEISFTLPIVVLIFDRFFFGKEWNLKKSVLYLIPLLLTLFIIPLDKPQSDVFSRDESGVFKMEGESVLSGLDAKKLSSIPRKDYMLTELRVILTYMRLFFFPVNLNFDYDYPIYKSFLEPNVILSFLFILFLFAIVIYFYHSSHSNSQLSTLNSKLLSFGILWFFITLSIESFVAVLNYVVFEYRLYLPSIGLILVLTGLISYASAYLKEKIRHISAAIIVIVTILSVATYMRNEVLKDEITLWEDSLKKFPKNFRIYNQLASVYEKRGAIDKAIEFYGMTLKAKPDDIIAHYNLGLIYAGQQQIDKAINEFQMALSLDPNHSEAHNNLGNAYYIQGDFDKAMHEYIISLKLDPDNAEAHNNIGDIYMKIGLIDKAIEHYQDALKINPSLTQTLNSLNSAYRMKSVRK